MKICIITLTYLKKLRQGIFSTRNDSMHTDSRFNSMLPWPIMLLSIVILFQQSWVPGFFQDGYLYAALSKNAAEGGHWLVPRLSESTYPVFFHHTPFLFMLQGLFFKVFGASYTTARLFGGLFTLGTVLLLYRWCLLLQGKKLAYYACFLLITLLPLIKKSRFPNLDSPLMLTTLLAIYFYTRFLVEKNVTYWFPVGISFGLALLIKGPSGLFPCFVIAAHALATRNVSLYSVGAFLLGLALFAIWPLSLYLTDQLNVFWNYWEFTFKHTITQGRDQDFDLFVYPIFLLKYSGPWVLLAAWGGYLAIKSHLLLPLIYFASIFIPLSLATLKYSNYLLPLYPALATLAALPLTRLGEKAERRFQNAIKIFAVSLALILLIFPLTVTIKRDPELHKAMELTQALESPPKTWVIIDGAYSYFPAANFLAFHNNSKCFSWNKKQFTQWLTQENSLPAVFIINTKNAQHIESQNPVLFQKKLFKLAQFKNRELLFLVPKQHSGNAPLLSL